MTMDIEEIAAAVKRSRKYRHLCRRTIVRVAEWAAARSRSQKEATKRTKRKLHQVYAAYLGHWDADAANALLDELPAGGDLEAASEICLRVMRQHVSTRERLESVEQSYATIFEITGTPSRVLDLGCGLHPFSLPWMGLPGDARYTAWEIDERIVSLVNRFLCYAGLTPLARCKDILADEPTEAPDLAFLLKILPSLEQQQKGCTLRLLERIHAPFVVVSFPVRSIGGRDKGMEAQYAENMEAVLAQSAWQFVRLELRQELFFVVDKREGHLDS